jgi:bifunctional non-homologous end joining protein LigD
MYEIEWDGIRVIGFKEGRVQHLFSSAGECLDERFPEVVGALGSLACRSAVIDGQIIAWDHDGRPSQQELMKQDGRRVLHMAVFDLLMLEGRDLREKPLVLRRAALAAMLPTQGGCMMSYSRELHGPPDQLLQRAQELRVCGIVAKQRDSFYESGERPGSWLLCRPEMEEAFVVGGYVPGEETFDELILGKRSGRKLRFVARLRAGFMPASRHQVMTAMQGQEQSECPFPDEPEASDTDERRLALDGETMRHVRWLKPGIEVAAAFGGWTDEGTLRNPRFTGLLPA